MTEPTVVRDEGWDRFLFHISQLFITIETCIKERRIIPALILLYAGMDAMSWLDRSTDHPDVQCDDFLRWVDSYVLGRRGLLCTSVDLYAARCALLHSHIAESKLSREGKAREVYYFWGSADIVRRKKNAVALNVEGLFGMFKSGVEAFKEDLSNDPERGERVYNRAERYLTQIEVGPVGSIAHYSSK